MEEVVKKTRKKETPVGIDKANVESFHHVAVEVASVIQTNSVTNRAEVIRGEEVIIITGAAWNIQSENGKVEPRESNFSTVDWKFIAASETYEELIELLK